MKQYKPSFYDSFRCLASACPDTCCQDWDIQVDEKTAAYYRTVPGPLGDRIRNSLREEDGETIIALQDHHCPMQSAEGLCGIQTALGEQALCQVCREFPRLTHDYGSFVELGLELSCPEAARLLLTSVPGPTTCTELPGGTDPDYEEEAMEILLSTRNRALEFLADPDYSVGEALSLLFFYGVHTQALLDGEEMESFDPELSLKTARSMAGVGSIRNICRFFAELEILTPQWKELLQSPAAPQIPSMARNLARYFVGRYWLQAVSDYDLYCRVKFILISVILIFSLPGDPVWNAHLYSKEIENDIDNVDAILDAAYGDSLFTDDKLLGFLLGSSGNAKL